MSRGHRDLQVLPDPKVILVMMDDKELLENLDQLAIEGNQVLWDQWDRQEWMD